MTPLAEAEKRMYGKHIGGLAERLRGGLQIRKAKLTQPTVFTEKSAMSPTVKNGRTLRERPVNPSSAEVA